MLHIRICHKSSFILETCVWEWWWLKYTIIFCSECVRRCLLYDYICIEAYIVLGYDMFYIQLSPKTDLWNLNKFCSVTYYIKDLALYFFSYILMGF